MLYREIISVCSQIQTKHINTLCGQNVQLLNVKLVVHHVTSRLYKVGQIPYKELHSNRATNLGTKEEVKLSCPHHEGTQGGAEV